MWSVASAELQVESSAPAGSWNPCLDKVTLALQQGVRNSSRAGGWGGSWGHSNI